jgi:hypothetical protein
MFHNTLNTQLINRYSDEDYMLTLEQMETVVSTEELFMIGEIFEFLHIYNT